MQANKLLQLVLKQYGHKPAAAALGMHLSSIYKWCEADDGKASGMWNPLVRLARLTALTGDPRPVEWLCRAAGGHFTPHPPVKRPLPVAARLPAACRVLTHLAHVQAALLPTLPGCQPAPAPTEALREKWDALQAEMERLLQSYERAHAPK